MLNGNYGILNQALAALGLGQPQGITDPRLKLFSVLMVDVWMWTPFMMLICLAGLNAIPAHLYEAAAIDRASRWTVFRRITLPLCGPLVGLAVWLMKGFIDELPPAYEEAALVDGYSRLQAFWKIAVPRAAPAWR